MDSNQGQSAISEGIAAKQLEDVTKVFNDLVARGLVIRKGGWYNVISGGEKINLGQKADVAILAFKSHVDSDKINLTELLNSKPTGPVNPAIITGSNGNPTSNPPRDFTASGENQNPEGVDFSAALSKLKDVQSYDKEKALTVYVNGIKSTLTDHPVIKACPIHLRWMEKTGMISDGKGLFTIKGYRVLMKDDFKIKGSNGKRFITTERDDTPGEAFITIGQLVLCYTEKEAFQKRKLKKSLEASLKINKVADQRNQFAQQQALTDPTEAENNFGALNANDRKTMGTAVDIDAIIDNSKNMEEATQKISEVVNASQVTNDGIPGGANPNQF